jgi:hypothetical protein
VLRLKIRSPQWGLPERWEPVHGLRLVRERGCSEVQPALPKGQAQGAVVAPVRQWFERAGRRSGIELRKPFL